jgi:hypothetical protein
MPSPVFLFTGSGPEISCIAFVTRKGSNNNAKSATNDHNSTALRRSDEPLTG